MKKTNREVTFGLFRDIVKAKNSNSNKSAQEVSSKKSVKFKLIKKSKS